MCVRYRKQCECGRNAADLNFRDNILPPHVVVRLYCPDCSMEGAFDAESMLSDKGWVLQYDMEMARTCTVNLPQLVEGGVTPDRIFDEGYATWLGIYPGDQDDSRAEREGLVALAKADPREYMNRMRTWAVSRMERLRQDGWRKAREG